jgi:AraC-like DNA-binding protein
MGSQTSIIDPANEVKKVFRRLMMPASAALLDRHSSKIRINDVNSETSSEISRLLLRAINCVERDEAIAIDLMKRASTLLRPFAVSEEQPGSRAVAGGLAPWQVARVKRFIEEQISQSISLDELSQLVRLSTSYFSAAFKVSFGTSPHSYIISRRVEFAKQRMLHSDAPLCEIALDCGLADQAHLSRLFRRVTGTTPSAWRRYRAQPGAAAMSA